jgi:prevent-host-death family protein
MTKRRKTGKLSPKPGRIAELHRLETWKLEDAKARLSEVVRLAGTRGPQLVTVRGKEAAVILSPGEFQRLQPPKRKKPLVDFLQELRLRDIPLLREPDTGRDTAL